MKDVMSEPSKVITAVSGGLGTVALVGVAVYWLTEQSTQGNQAATLILAFMLFVFILLFALGAWGFVAWVQSLMQRRATESTMEYMRMNAIENQQIMNDIQKGLLLQAQTQRQLNAGDVESARLLNMLQKNQPENDARFFGGNGATIIDQAFSEAENG